MENPKNNEAKNDHVCPHRMAFMLDNWLRKLVQNPRKILAGYVQEGDWVMDVGCGPGFFTTELARMVGKRGKVIAADLQIEMLTRVKKKATRKGLMDRIILHQCLADRINLKEIKPLDFVLAFYMIHETPSPENFLREMKEYLKPGGKLLAVEPRMHVNEEKFQEMVQLAEKIEFEVLDIPPSRGGRTLLLSRPR